MPEIFRAGTALHPATKQTNRLVPAILVISRFDLQDLLRQPQIDVNQVLSKQREVSELESRIQERW
jgi:hypothetical protein